MMARFTKAYFIAMTGIKCLFLCQRPSILNCQRTQWMQAAKAAKADSFSHSLDLLGYLGSLSLGLEDSGRFSHSFFKKIDTKKACSGYVPTGLLYVRTANIQSGEHEPHARLGIIR